MLPTTISIMGGCASAGAGTGLHALGAARRSLRAIVLMSIVFVVCGLVGAFTGGAVGTMRGAAVGAWIGALLFWWRLARRCASRAPKLLARQRLTARPGGTAPRHGHFVARHIPGIVGKSVHVTRSVRLHSGIGQTSFDAIGDPVEKGFLVGQPGCTVMRLLMDADLSSHAMAATGYPELPGHGGVGDALAGGLADSP